MVAVNRWMCIEQADMVGTSSDELCSSSSSVSGHELAPDPILLFSSASSSSLIGSNDPSSFTVCCWNESQRLELDGHKIEEKSTR